MKKGISLILIFLITLLTGCNNNESLEEEIVIWANCTDKELKAFTELCDKWGDDNNISINLINSTVNEIEFNAVKESKYDAPDIIWGISSEKLEWLIENNCIEELDGNIENLDDYISEDIVENTSLNGKRYGVPIYVETLALYYNKDMVDEVPKTMDELLKVSEKEGLSFDITNGYFSYGFISTCGGYIFKNNNGTFDYNDIGLANDGAIEGYKVLQDIGVKYKLISQDINDDSAEACFVIGKSAFYLGESKKIDNFKETNMNFGIAVIPSINNNPFKPFKEVKMSFVNPFSSEKDKSYELLKFMVDNGGEILIKDGNKIPANKKYVNSEAFKENVYLQSFYKQLETAEVTPNIYELEAYWQTISNNLQLLTLGQITPEECGEKSKSDLIEYVEANFN